MKNLDAKEPKKQIRNYKISEEERFFLNLMGKIIAKKIVSKKVLSS